MRRLCVFCGSAPGARPSYLDAAERLGTALARRGIGLVYGGSSVGLMGAIADATLAAGGEAIGVIPFWLSERELAHGSLTELHQVESMHERKALMAQLSDGFVALPGGLGTFDELFEALTWGAVGLHDKRCGLLDVDDYFGPLRAAIDHGVTEGFIRAELRDGLVVATDPDEIIDRVGGQGE